MFDATKLKNIKMLVLDVDGVLTDTRIFLDANGEWKRFFSIRDGLGIRQLIERGYKTAIITASKSKDIQERAKVLGIHYFYEGAQDKTPALEQLMLESKLSANEMAYMGDDLPDIPILKRVGFSATPPDAVDEVLKSVNYIARRTGGQGAVRELCDMIRDHGFYSEEKYD